MIIPLCSNSSKHQHNLNVCVRSWPNTFRYARFLKYRQMFQQSHPTDCDSPLSFVVNALYDYRPLSPSALQLNGPVLNQIFQILIYWSRAPFSSRPISNSCSVLPKILTLFFYAIVVFVHPLWRIGWHCVNVFLP